MRAALLTLALATLAGCASSPRNQSASEPFESTRPSTESRFIEVFPHVRLDLASRTIEIDARIATDMHDPQTPDVYLELIACSPDSREHEALVVTDARPSHIHAALLMLGLEPGSPGRFELADGSLRAIPPTGPPLEVHFRVPPDGGAALVPPENWIEVLPDRSTLGPQQWVFAGSAIRRIAGQERYWADLEGTIIGLTTFGSEVISPLAMHHPDSMIQTPSFLARNPSIPKFAAPVAIIIRSSEDRSEP
ncbi:MAG: hypothetical protein KF757_10120 [Phycisphaeraceae bacterium]|nr:hypothetical protein [Phycisphaeraceae bacterium]MCW5763569.1 hypothetical protein [Phycisphaeraceae bacterium]